MLVIASTDDLIGEHTDVSKFDILFIMVFFFNKF